MGRSDEFHWVTDAEPHSTRRREILAKHGDKVRKLYGYDHSTAVQVRRPLCFDQRLPLQAFYGQMVSTLVVECRAEGSVSVR